MAKRLREEPEHGLLFAKDSAMAYQNEAQGVAKEEQAMLRLTKEGPENPDIKEFCGAFAAIGMDNSWDLADFRRGFSIQMRSMSEEVVEFDMIGIDPPLINAFRRILIAEVPTIAISRVTISQNTGALQDENLAHRLGLVPIATEPDDLKWKGKDQDFTEENSIKFALKKSCDDAQGKLSIYSRDLEWVPMGAQQAAFYKDNPPRPVVGDILITQLRRGQELECECLCEKDIGKEHAKWSPVCTASYRLMPVLRHSRSSENEDAQELHRVRAKTIFDLDEGASGRRELIKSPASCSTSRRQDSAVANRGLMLTKAKNHFMFTIESVGQVPAPLLFERALEKLRDKCEVAKALLANSEH